MAQSALLAGPPGAEVEVEADRIIYTWQPPVVRLEGHVVARRARGLLVARRAGGSWGAGRAPWGRPGGILRLGGGGLGTRGREVFGAAAAIVVLTSTPAEMTNSVLFPKARPPNPDAPRAGPNSLIVHSK